MHKRRSRLTLFASLFFLIVPISFGSVGRLWAAKIKVPPVAALQPIYKLPTIALAEKETKLYKAVLRNHLNKQGYLLYRSYLPFSDPGNYQLSHNSADLPAWHGHWVAALAMKLAVESSPEMESLLLSAIKGLRSNFEATGITGLLARAYLEYGGDEPLPWMATKDQAPTKFWQQGKNGFWFRNGVTKGHYGGAVFGLATVIGLENRGAISLESGTSSLVRKTLIEIAHYLIDNSYRIIDANGKETEFGRLTWRNNGFNALQLLAMLRAGKAIGDGKCAKEYESLVSSGVGRVIANTLKLLGGTNSRLGRQRAFGHFSDDEMIYTNAFTLFINSDEEDKRTLQYVNSALRSIWQFLRYSRKSHMTFIHAILLGVSEKERGEALETLRMFPDDKRLISNLESEDTHSVQPIANQKINSHYWKSDYFRKATLTDASGRMDIEHSGQDYLFVYWMGRYFGLISEEEAAAAVKWKK